MSMIEFSQVAGNSDTLTCEEKASIYYYIGTQDHVNHTMSFDYKKRVKPTEKMADRFSTVYQSNWGCSYQQDAIEFKTNISMMLTAIGTYPISNNNGYYYSTSYSIPNNIFMAVDVTQKAVYDPNDFSYLFSTGAYQTNTRVGGVSSYMVNSTSFNNTHIARLPLDQPIEIKAGTSYIISIRQVNGNSCYSRYGNSYYSYDPIRTSDATIWFSNAGYGSTSTSSGQIPRMYYIPM
jgi:hypothetical protein